MIDSDTTAAPPLPSNQKFGWFFTFVFSIAAAYAYWKDASAWAIAFVVAAALFALFTLVAPAALAPLNRLWAGLGLLLGKIVSPIVLGLIFFVVLTPVSVVTRLFGRDALLMKKRDVESYWVDRTPPGPAPDSFKNQF